MRASGAQRQADGARGGREEARARRQVRRRRLRTPGAPQARVLKGPSTQQAAHRRPGQGRSHAQGRTL